MSAGCLEANGNAKLNVMLKLGKIASSWKLLTSSPSSVSLEGSSCEYKMVGNDAIVNDHFGEFLIDAYTSRRSDTYA